MTKPTFFMLALLWATQVQSQDFNALPGWVLTTQGDTLRGMVRDRANQRSAMQFRPEGKTEYRAYKPTELAAFFYGTGNYFRSVLAPVTDSTMEQVFLSCLAEGDLNLYFEDHIYFFQKNLEKPVRLDYKITSAYDKGPKTVRAKRTLEYVLADCPDVVAKIGKLSINTNSLAQIVEQYNQCKSPGAAPAKSLRKKFRPVLGARLAASVTKFNYIGRYDVYNFSPSMRFSGGPTINFQASNKVSVQIGLIYAAKKSTGRYTDYYGEKVTRFELATLQVPIVVNYHFPAKRFRPFVGGGFIYGTKVSNTSTFEKTKAIIIDRDELGYRLNMGVPLFKIGKMSLSIEYGFEQSLFNRRWFDRKFRSTVHMLGVGVMF